MIAPYHIFGPSTGFLDGKDRVSSPRKLDTLRLPVISPREDTFDNGGPIPGYPLIEIEEVTTKELVPGQRYHHTLTGKGLLKPGHKLESSSLTQPEEGWDEGPQTWLTTTPDSFQIGTVHPDIPSLWCVAIDNKDKVTQKITRIVATYKGIIPLPDGNPKPERWKATVNGQTINTTDGVTLGHTTPEVFVDENGAYNGWPVSLKGSLDASQINLICTKLSTTPPPTERVGLHLTPGRIPITVYSIFDEPGWSSAAGITYNYPPGWKLAGVQFDQVLDKAVYLYTLTFAYQPIYVPIL